MKQRWLVYFFSTLLVLGWSSSAFCQDDVLDENGDVITAPDSGSPTAVDEGIVLDETDVVSLDDVEAITSEQADSAAAGEELDADEIADLVNLEQGGAANKDRYAGEKVWVSLFDQDPKQRASALKSLGRKGDIRSLGFLLSALRDKSPVVRKAAAQALVSVGTFEALGALKKAQVAESKRGEDKEKVGKAIDKAIGALEEKLFAGGGEPVVLKCHSCGKTFALLRKTKRGYCPYDGTPWTLKK